jgi:hypothetical protein
MSSCQTEVIYHNNDFVFTRCLDCGRMGMMYRQAMIAFDEASFESFQKYLLRMDFDQEKYPFFDGLDRVVIETYHPDVQFTLLEEEFYRLKALVIEANTNLKLIDTIRRM